MSSDRGGACSTWSLLFYTKGKPKHHSWDDVKNKAAHLKVAEMQREKTKDQGQDIPFRVSSFTDLAR